MSEMSDAAPTNGKGRSGQQRRRRVRHTAPVAPPSRPEDERRPLVPRSAEGLQYRAWVVALARVIGIGQAAQQTGVDAPTIRQWDRLARRYPPLGLAVDRVVGSAHQVLRPLLVRAQSRLLRGLEELVECAVEQARAGGEVQHRLVKEVRIAVQSLGELGLAAQVVEARTEALRAESAARGRRLEPYDAPATDADHGVSVSVNLGSGPRDEEEPGTSPADHAGRPRLTRYLPASQVLGQDTPVRDDVEEALAAGESPP